MEIPWTNARDFLAATVKIERERLVSQAVAARAVQAEGKHWKAWVKGMEN